MALNFATGSFTITSGTGTQAVTISPAFQPKVVICWWDRNTAEATFTAHNGFGFGVAVDAVTDQQSVLTFYNTDNVATTDSQTTKATDKLIKNQATVADGSNVIATISSFNSDGFTINKTTNDGTNLNIVKYVCLGGSDITNAFLGEFAVPSTGAGNKSYSGVGFQPNFGLFWGMSTAVAGNLNAIDYDFFLGATNGTQQNLISFYGNDGSTSANQAESYINSGLCQATADGGTLDSGVNRGAFVSWDSDGFTFNYANSDTINIRFFGLLLKGPFQSHIGQQARPTSTGDQDYTTVGFQPAGVMFAGGYATANNTETVQAHLSLGASDGTNNVSKWWGDAAVINTDVNMYSSATKCYTQATNPSTVAAQASLTSMLSNGYRLNWSTADATARLFYHIAFGSGSSAPMFRGS